MIWGGRIGYIVVYTDISIFYRWVVWRVSTISFIKHGVFFVGSCISNFLMKYFWPSSTIIIFLFIIFYILIFDHVVLLHSFFKTDLILYDIIDLVVILFDIGCICGFYIRIFIILEDILILLLWTFKQKVLLTLSLQILMILLWLRGHILHLNVFILDISALQNLLDDLIVLSHLQV